MLPTYFISHGGGPWPYIAEMRSQLQILEQSLLDIPRQLPHRPSAILVVSGHWETAQFSVMAAAQPAMVYDYSGFPAHTYHVKYPAAGDPALARQVHQLIEGAGLPARLDDAQGFDHGTFTPLQVMYPHADIPVLQVSLQQGYDPARHLALGRALAPLRQQGVLMIGSGLSYHNLRQFGPGARDVSKTFDDWLQQTLFMTDFAAREQRLLDWSVAPAARQAHPREDHLMPLMVALGAAEHEPVALVYHETQLFGGVTASSFRFGAAA